MVLWPSCSGAIRDEELWLLENFLPPLWVVLEGLAPVGSPRAPGQASRQQQPGDLHRKALGYLGVGGLGRKRQEESPQGFERLGSGKHSRRFWGPLGVPWSSA